MSGINDHVSASVSVSISDQVIGGTKPQVPSPDRPPPSSSPPPPYSPHSPDAASHASSSRSDDADQILRITDNKQSSAPMGENNSNDYLEFGEGNSPMLKNYKKVSMLPLMFLIFYEVSGGPFGVENSVHAAGPFLALLGFLVFPFIWSVPEALITAELGSMFPENGGYVVWVSAALGPYWGFQEGWMKWCSGVIDNAVYPVLFIEYVVSVIPALKQKLVRTIVQWAITVVLTYLNYRGLTIVGWVAVLLGIFSLAPFVIMGLISIPKLKPSRWLVTVKFKTIDWGLYLNTLFWNLNYWDSISTLSGEVENPGKNLPKALFYAMLLVVFGYFFSLLSGIGAIPFDREAWNDGYFSDIAKMIGGVWLMVWIQGAAAVSNMGMFVAEMSSDSFQLLGMAEYGMLPELFSKRSRHGTPWIAILFSASGVIVLSWLNVEDIIAAENFLYCFGMLLEFVAFIQLRRRYPEASRPYKIPLGTFGTIFMCVPPTILIIAVLCLCELKVFYISLGIIVFGVVLPFILNYIETKHWLKFSVKSDFQDFYSTNAPTAGPL